MLFDAGASAGTAVHSEPFEYVATPEGGGGNGPGTADVPWVSHGSGRKEQAEKREKESYERGLRDGDARALASCEARVQKCQEAVRATIEAFKSEREEYFNRIEPEVVQLAVAIARKILHRESQIDPLLLTGLVHVALEKLDVGTRVRLKVHPGETHFWNEFFARSGENAMPELLGDPALQHGECVLESEVGSTQISLETQLKEIEQGFFDLLEQRPRVR